MKKIITIVIVSILLIVFVILDIYLYKNTFYDKYDYPKEVVFEYNNEVDVFSDVNYYDLISNNNIEILISIIFFESTESGCCMVKLEF